MRRDTTVTFKEQADHTEIVMDEEGNFNRGQAGESWTTMAHVSALGSEKEQLLFGEVTSKRKVVRILYKPSFEPGTIHMNEKDYRIDRSLILRNKSVYTVSEL